MPQMAPTLWLLMLLTLTLIIVVMQTSIYFWNKYVSLEQNKSGMKIYKKNWLW